MKFSPITRLLDKNRLFQTLAPKRLRKAREHGRVLLALEVLEDRNLLSVLPSPLITDHSSLTGPSDNNPPVDHNTPQIAVDPTNPLNVVAAYTRNDPTISGTQKVFVDAQFSADGGGTWTPLIVPFNFTNPASPANNPQPFVRASDPSVQFDRQGNFYILYTQHAVNYSTGAIVLQKYRFGDTDPTPFQRNEIGFDPIFGEANDPAAGKVLYEWTQDPIYNPVLAVDTNVSGFIDPATKVSGPVDPSVNNVYVAWWTNKVVPTNTSGFNPSTIQVLASADGGETFTTQITANDLLNFGGTERSGTPQLAVRPDGSVALMWDDFGTGATANPPVDLLVADLIPAGGQGVTAVGSLSGNTTGDSRIPDASNPGGGAPHDPGIESWTATVSGAPPGFQVTDLDVTIALTHADLTQVRIDLTSPGGKTVTLLNNRRAPNNAVNNNTGTAGANLGTTTSGIFLGTVFDDEAARSIRNNLNGATAPFTGHFRPEDPSLFDGFVLSEFDGLTGAQINGDWTLTISDSRDNGTAPINQFLIGWTLNFTSTLTDGLDTDTLASLTAVRGPTTFTGGVPTFGTAVPAAPERGAGPGVSLAADTTLGSFSPFQGRIYAAYVDRDTTPGASPSDTNIFLISSDDAGATWSSPVQVNDDFPVQDGFSQGDRTQFQPTVAVDALTGTVVVTYYDARYDVTNSRVARMIQTSIDGGETFSRSTFLNTPGTAFNFSSGGLESGSVFDPITQQVLADLRPLPDNQSTGNAGRDTVFNFGDRQGLAVGGGRVYAVWAGNENGGIDGTRHLDVLTAQATIAGGPRIVDSTQGVVGEPGDSLNNSRAGDGTPEARSILVTFDRPIDVSTFTADDVTIFYRRPGTSGNAPADRILTASSGANRVLDVVPVNGAGTFGPGQQVGGINPATGRPWVATQFRIDFTPQSDVGTYSYTIGPNIRDTIRTGTTSAITLFTNTYTVTPNPVDLAIPSLNTVTSTITVTDPAAPPLVVTDVNVNVRIDHPFVSDLRLTLIAPNGTRIDLVRSFDVFGTDFGTGSTPATFVYTTFDDQATQLITTGTAPFTGSFRPVAPLSSLIGLNPNGVWTLEIEDDFFLDDGVLRSWQLVIGTGTIDTGTVSPGNLLDQTPDAIPGQTPTDIYAIPEPLDPAASFTGPPPNFFAPPFNSLTLPLIVPGPHVVSTRIPGQSPNPDNLVLDNPVTAIDVTFDRDMDPASFTGADVVRVIGPAGQIGTPQTFRPSIPAPLTIPGPQFGNPGVLTSELTIPGVFYDLADLTVELDITHPRVSDLTAELVAPDGTRIALFQNVGGLGQNFTGTIFDDAASTDIADGMAPFTGSFRPAEPLGTFAGANVHGRWQLVLTDSVSGSTGTLNSWSLTATPQPITVTPLNSRTFRIGIPEQRLSGTYTVTLGPGEGTLPAIRSTRDSNPADGIPGDPIDTKLNAGLDALRGLGSTSTVVQYDSADVPTTIAPSRTIRSTLTVPDNFLIQDLNVQLNITFPSDPDLVARLIAPFNDASGNPVTVILFSNVGTTGSQANFQDTILDDNASTPIQNGGPPFNGRFVPQFSLNSAFGGRQASGQWILEIENQGISTGTLNSWSLPLRRPVSPSGVGEAVADQHPASFRIFNQDPANPLAHNQWTAVGPAAANGGPGAGVNGNSGRIGGLAVDPSDPSGNTVYVAGASGGVWKTTNFLTTDPDGPTYIPLTDFGPTFGINIGSLAVFSRNDDPNQSIVFAATGEGDIASPGVGFLRSMDGGATWELLDSTDNTLPFAQRDHILSGTTAFKVVVDPVPTPPGGVLVFAALSGGQGGIWRSFDTGDTWERVLAGDMTDVVLDPASTTLDAFGRPVGNAQFLYAANRGTGVFFSPDRGESWQEVLGGIGNPLIQDGDVPFPTPVPVNDPPDNPSDNGQGRILLAKPFLTGNPLQDLLYEGWLYALVVTSNDLLRGLYLTKDFGQNWTRINIPTLSDPMVGQLGIPTNDPAQNDYDVFGNPQSVFPGQGNYDVVFAIDPTNPNVVYMGGTANGSPFDFIRVDTTLLADAHAFYLGNEQPSPGTTSGALRIADQSAVILKGWPNMPGAFINPVEFPLINLIRDPFNPFANNTVLVSNTARFTNTGVNATWTPFLAGINNTTSSIGTDFHELITFVDPLTGRGRLIYGNDHVVGTQVDLYGEFDLPGLNRQPQINGDRTGNLQITQFYYGAVHPSNLAAQIAGSQFYGQAQDDGSIQSGPNVLDTGDIVWTGPLGDGSDVATDQTGSGTVYRYNWPCCGGGGTDFFQMSVAGGPFVGRTFGLIRNNSGSTPFDTQWDFVGSPNNSFAINPIVPSFGPNGEETGQLLISSKEGRIYETINNGLVWVNIAEPGQAFADATHKVALAFGAPDPNAPNGVGAFNNFLYAGSLAGNVFVTFTGGGGGGATQGWFPIFGGAGAVRAIITNPQRGTREAYIVTDNGVFHTTDSAFNQTTGQVDYNNPNPVWVNITSNLFAVTHENFAPFNTNNTTTDTQLRRLFDIVADWRYVIPNDPADPAGSGAGQGPGLTHPILYVGGESGVYRSLDDGLSWELFPAVDDDPIDLGVPQNGGMLANAFVRDLDLALGNINPDTGRPDQFYTDEFGRQVVGPNILAATTFGRATFAIQLAPIILTDVAPLQLSPDGPLPPSEGGSDSGLSFTDRITRVTEPIITGFSEQSAFGNTVTIELVNLTPGDATFGQVIGSGPTDAFSNFAVAVQDPNFQDPVTQDPEDSIWFNIDTGTTDGLKTIGVRGVDDAGTVGNFALFEFTLDTTPSGVANAPDLLDPDDSGPSNTDDITRITRPRFQGTAEPDGVVELLVDGRFEAMGTANAAGNWLIQVATPLADGTYDITAQVIDVAGNAGPMSDVLMVTIDTTPPAAPSVPDLIAADDRGSSNTDDRTNVTRPRFQGMAEPNATVQLFVGSAANATGVADGSGNWEIQLAAPLADGTYAITAWQTDLAGNTGPKSDAVMLTIATTPPAAPSIPDLLTDDDTGVSNTDNITDVRQPRFQGVADPNVVVQLFVDGVANATGVADGAGNWLIQLNNPLADGTYAITARQTDTVGNVGPLSSALTVAIDITPPGPPTVPDLIPADDGGTSNTDNITNVTRPRFQGVADPNAVVQLFVNGVANATGMADGSGNWLIQLNNPLADGNHAITARQTDPLDRTGPVSGALAVAIDTNPPAAPTTPDLIPADDNGSSNTDDRTRVVQPRFQGMAESNAVVQLFVDGLPEATGVADDSGNWLIRLNNPLSVGDHNISARQTDEFGNVGPQSQTLLVTILPPPPPPPPETVGMFDPFSGFWYLRSQNNSGPPDAGAFPYGLPGWRPVIGDWNGDGIDTVGVVDPSGVWYLRNSNSPGAPDIAPFPFGLGPWTPVVGDWDGDGIDGIGMVDTATGIWYLRNTPSQGPPDVGAFPYGLPGWVPVVGDWNGDGTHTLGTFDPTTGIWYLRNSNTPGGPDVVPFPYGLPGWKPVAGDWDGDKISTPGVVDPTGRWYLQNHNPATFPEIVRFPYGVGSWTPLSGTYVGQLALHAAAGEAADLAPLDPAVLQSVVTAALPRLAALETDPGVLDRVQAAGVMVANLPDNLLGLADEVNNRIWIDSDAAGNGWFLDATPFDDSEFGSDGTALAGSGAEGRIDLLSAVAHELGHLAGLEDLPGNDQDLMGAVLDTGRRRIRALDALFADGL